MLESLTSIPPDPLLKLIGEFASDKRAHKIDLGVGVYRNAAGRTDVMKASGFDLYIRSPASLKAAEPPVV